MVRRGTYFILLKAESGGGDDFIYTGAMAASYEESVEWVGWVASLLLTSDSYARVRQVRASVPINP